MEYVALMEKKKNKRKKNQTQSQQTKHDLC